jgi:hypothetical protein
MTQKQQAKQMADELFTKFYMILFDADSDISEECVISILAKKCALLHIELVIKDSVDYNYRYLQVMGKAVKELKRM